MLRMCKSDFLLKTGALDLAWQEIEDIHDPSLEVLMLKANILASAGNHHEAFCLLRPVWDRAYLNLRFCKQFFQHQMDARDGSDIQEKLAIALEVFGEHPQLLYHCTSINLFKRQPLKELALDPNIEKSKNDELNENNSADELDSIEKDIKSEIEEEEKDKSYENV